MIDIYRWTYRLDHLMNICVIQCLWWHKGFLQSRRHIEYTCSSLFGQLGIIKCSAAKEVWSVTAIVHPPMSSVLFLEIFQFVESIPLEQYWAAGAGGHLLGSRQKQRSIFCLGNGASDKQPGWMVCFIHGIRDYPFPQHPESLHLWRLVSHH